MPPVALSATLTVEYGDANRAVEPARGGVVVGFLVGVLTGRRVLARRLLTRQWAAAGVTHRHGAEEAIFAIAQTDLILTVPRKLAKVVAKIAGVRVVEPPREIKAFPYFMAWHPRLTNEAAHTWFRDQVRMAARII